MHTTHRVLIPVSELEWVNMSLDELTKEYGSRALTTAEEHNIFDYGEVEEVVFGKLSSTRFKKELDTALDKLKFCFADALSKFAKTKVTKLDADLLRLWHAERGVAHTAYEIWKFGVAINEVLDSLLGQYTFDRGFLDTESGVGDLDEEYIKRIAERADEYAIVLLNVHN